MFLDTGVATNLRLLATEAGVNVVEAAKLMELLWASSFSTAETFLAEVIGFALLNWARRLATRSLTLMGLGVCCCCWRWWMAVREASFLVLLLGPPFKTDLATLLMPIISIVGVGGVSGEVSLARFCVYPGLLGVTKSSSVLVCGERGGGRRGGGLE